MSIETNSELDQANLRIVVAGIAIVYISVLGFLPGQSLDTYLPVILYIALFEMLLEDGLPNPLSESGACLPSTDEEGAKSTNPEGLA